MKKSVLLYSLLVISTVLNGAKNKSMEDVREAARVASINTVEHQNFHAQRQACSAIKQIVANLEVAFGKDVVGSEGYAVLQKQNELLVLCEENERFLEKRNMNTLEYKNLQACWELEKLFGNN